MFQFVFIPDLEHCIETTAKKEYSDLTRKLLAGKSNQIARYKTKILKEFLETADFKKLRVNSEKYLAEGKIVKFIVYTKNGVSKCDMIVT